MDVRLTMHSNFLSSSPAATQQKERERERKEMDLTSADHHAAAASTCPGCLSSTWLQDSTSPLLWCLALVLDTQSCVASCLVDSQRFQTQWVPDFSLLFRCWTSMFWLESPCVARRHTTLAVQDCVGTVWTCVHKAPQLSTWLWTHTFGTNSVGMTELQTPEDQAVVGMPCRKPLDILQTRTHACRGNKWNHLNTQAALTIDELLRRCWINGEVPWWAAHTYSGRYHTGFYTPGFVYNHYANFHYIYFSILVNKV